jgi:hypothetical protein
VTWLSAWELASWSNESVVGYLLAGKDEAENTVRTDYQETTSEDKEDVMCAEVTVIFRVCKPVSHSNT